MEGSLGWGRKLALVLSFMGALGCVAEEVVGSGDSPPVEELPPEVMPKIPTASNTGTLWLESIEARPASGVWSAGDGTLLLRLVSGEAVVIDPAGQVVLETVLEFREVLGGWTEGTRSRIGAG